MVGPGTGRGLSLEIEPDPGSSKLLSSNTTVAFIQRLHSRHGGPWRCVWGSAADLFGTFGVGLAGIGGGAILLISEVLGESVLVIVYQHDGLVA